MKPLPVETMDRLVAQKAGVPMSVAVVVSKASRSVAQAESNPHLSMQEIARAASEVWHVAESKQDVCGILAGWAARTAKGEAAAVVERLVDAVWSEVVAGRRVAGRA